MKVRYIHYFKIIILAMYSSTTYISCANSLSFTMTNLTFRGFRYTDILKKNSYIISFITYAISPGKT